jgi:hypothetical protein
MTAQGSWARARGSFDSEWCRCTMGCWQCGVGPTAERASILLTRFGPILFTREGLVLRFILSTGKRLLLGSIPLPVVIGMPFSYYRRLEKMIGGCKAP